MELLERIVMHPNVKVDQPIIRATCINLEQVPRMMRPRMSAEEIIKQYPYTTQADILACFRFAEKTMTDNIFLPLGAAENT